MRATYGLRFVQDALYQNIPEVQLSTMQCDRIVFWIAALYCARQHDEASHRGRGDVESKKRDGDDGREASRELHKLDDEGEQSPLGLARLPACRQVIFSIVHRQ